MTYFKAKFLQTNSRTGFWSNLVYACFLVGIGSACPLCPESGHVRCTRRCPLCANSGHHTRFPIASSGWDPSQSHKPMFLIAVGRL